MSKEIKIKAVFLFAIIFTILITYGTLANYASNTNGGGTTFNFNSSTSNTYNITINNADASQNITQVNITLPSSFTSIGAIWTSSANDSFSNSTTILSWTNSSGLIMNASLQNFSFSATNINPGNYNITIMLINASNIIVENLSVIINGPVIGFVNPTESRGSFINRNNILINVTANSNWSLTNVSVYLYNSTGAIINSTNSSTFPLFVNFTVSADDIYYFNATVYNLTGNINNTETRNVTVDTIVPSVSLTSTGNSTSSISLSYTANDSGSGIYLCYLYRNGGFIGLDSGLSCGNSYSYTITCADYAGNNNSATRSFSTTSCPSSSSSSTTTTSGLTSTDSSYWTSTYVASSEQFMAGFSKELSEQNRISFRAESNTHYLGIIKITASDVTINISSTPQQALFRVKDSKKFDVGGDGYYDLKVTLNSINTTSDKINVTIVSIYEKVVLSTGNAITPLPPVNVNLNSTNQSSTTANKGIFSNITIPSFLKNQWFVAGLILFIFLIGGVVYFVIESDEKNIEKKVKISQHSKSIRVH